MKTVEKISLISVFLLLLLFFIQYSFASSPPSSEIGDWVLENSSYTINAATITVHGDVYVKTTSTISIETGGNLKIGRFWTKRIPIIISTSVSPDIPDDYQIWVPTTVFTTAQWSDIKGGTGQADLDDVRFVSSMNATGYWENCPYWIESDTNTPKGFWVKISSINQANSNVYMYYGNANAVSASSGPATFEFFDDFSYNKGWTSTYPGETYVDTTNKNLYFVTKRCTSNSPRYAYIPLDYNISDFELEYKVAVLSYSSNYVYYYFGLTNAALPYSSANYADIIDQSKSASFMGQYRTVTGPANYWNGLTIDSGAADNSSSIGAWGASTWYTGILKKYNNQMYSEIWNNDKTSLLYTTAVISASLDDMSYILLSEVNGGDCSYGGHTMTGRVDDVLLRKYTEDEPIISAGTTEDTPTTGYYIYIYSQGQIYQQQGSGINK